MIPKSQDVNILSLYYDKIDNDRHTKTFFPSGSSHYKSDKRKLGLLKTENKMQLVILNTDNITCINRIKSIFGFGPLAHIDFSLEHVDAYLNYFNWKQIHHVTHTSEKDVKKALKSLCAVANCAARVNGSSQLFDAVSEEKIIKGFSFKINSQTEVRDLGSQIRTHIKKKRDLISEQQNKQLKLGFKKLFFKPTTAEVEEAEKLKASLESLSPEVDMSQIRTNTMLENLDKDHDKIELTINPCTQIKLNDGKILPAHALIPTELDTIETVQFVFRYAMDSTPEKFEEDFERSLNASKLVSCNVEKYKHISEKEDRKLMRDFVTYVKSLS